ncbi:MAG: branched-chain amino acid transport system II carrier protein [Flavobacteriaceae bacterium]|nr:branched-chain amino acid transport system II carrier protein [Flavobacteriaceae bacterium]
MPQNKRDYFIIGLALFSMFFGAGNLTLPPLLGLKAGDTWGWVTIGFILSGVVLPILAIYAHARLQGTMYDFGKKVSPIFSVVFCVIIYLISIAIPNPRTAALTHEMAVAPYFETSSLLTSTIYFALVFLFVVKRAKILHYIGKFLTPLIVGILLLIIGIGTFADHPEMYHYAESQTPFFRGFLEGYQTFDTLGGLLIGGVIIISLNLKGYTSYEDKKKILIKTGLIAGSGLALIYTGLILQGALFSSEFSADITYPDFLRGISSKTLGNIGTTFLSVLVSLACFTTAVGITTGTADYFKGLFNSQKAFIATAIIAWLFGIIVGQLDFHSIIVIAIPVLMVIYPITIVFILMNSLNDKWTSPIVFRAVTFVTMLFSIPDMLNHIPSTKESVASLIDNIPLASNGFGWFIPAFIIFIVMNFISFATHKEN